MQILNNDYEPLKCDECKKIVLKLVSLTDDGKGKKLCIRCKRKTKKANPTKDYRKVEVKK